MCSHTQLTASSQLLGRKHNQALADCINFLIYQPLFKLQHGIDAKLISAYNHSSELIKLQQLMQQVLTSDRITPLS